MVLIDFLGDMFICICNGQCVKKDFVFLLVLNLCLCVFEVLQCEGYICGYSEDVIGVYLQLCIEFKYFEGELVIKYVVCVLKLGCCVYLGSKEFFVICNGFGIIIVLMFCGVFLDVEVCVQNVGGEVFVEVF